MHQEYSESNGLRNDALNKENLMIDHGRLFPPRRTDFKETEMSSAVRSDGLSTINDHDETSLHEFSSSFDDRWITDEGKRCILIIWRRRGVAYDRPLDLDLVVQIWSEVHLMRIIWTVITRYRTVRMISLKPLLSTCLIRDPVDLDSTWSTCSICRDVDPTHEIAPHVLQIRKRKIIVPHGGN